MNEIWISMSIMNMLLPLVMIIFGIIFSKKAPHNINANYGYRTSKSMKNKETWDFAHHYFGKIWYKLGIVTLIFSVSLMIYIYNKEVNIIALFATMLTLIQVIVMLIPIYFTEKKLRQTFDKDGQRRQ